MKNIIATAALIALASAASAESLPEKKVTPVAPKIEVTQNGYVGVFGGGVVRRDQSIQDTPGVIGGVIGYNVNKNFALEGDIDQTFQKNGQRSVTRFTVNGLYSPFGEVYGFKPYALAGIGAQTHDVKDGVNSTKTVYDIGGGVKYAVTKAWELDTRYRYTNTLNNTNRDNSTVTVGVNYKF